MRNGLSLAIASIILLAGTPPLLAQEEEPVTVTYYYRVKWGYQQEFLRLFAKNHYPVLREQVKTGRLLDVKTYEPVFHGDGRADWTFMVTLVFKDWAVMADRSAEPEIIQRLYPDQETFRREEQRRFEILDAHWDVPLKPAPME